MLAAGASIDKFWSMYAQHQKAEVYDLLQRYRIGSLVRSFLQSLAPGLQSLGPTGWSKMLKRRSYKIKPHKT